MPTSLDRQPAENEIECARCGALFYYELTRCPKCGVNLYEPEGDDDDKVTPSPSHTNDIFAKIGAFLRRLSGKPDAAENLFDYSLRLAALHNDLLRKVGGDRETVERLIEFERQRLPEGNRLLWLQNAIQRWQQDNQ